MRRDDPLEEERFELDEDLPYAFDLGRRGFLKAIGGGLAVAVLASELPAQHGGGGRVRGPGEIPEDAIGAWVHVDEDGAITGFTGRVEMGQGTRTSCVQVIAEELGAPMDAITMVMGDTDRTPYDRGTWGSQSTPRMLPQLRRAAASARDLLVGLAAERWGVSSQGITVAAGRIAHPDGRRSLGFGELTRGERLVETLGPRPGTDAPDWMVCGEPKPKVRGRAIVTGAETYASDVTRPGMLHGKVLRPPAFGARRVSLDASEAEGMPGVTVVRDGDFVGVVGPDARTAQRAIEALDARWETRPQPSAAEIFDHLEAHPSSGASWRRGGPHVVGDVDAALDSAAVRLSGTYTTPYIAHVPLEPRAGVAEWTPDGDCHLWLGTQSPYGSREAVASTFGLPPERVHVQVPAFGSGYGGKTRTSEVAVEVARLARAAGGRPVRLVWTREEEFTWAYFRPAALIRVESGATPDGQLAAWRFRNVNSGGSAIRPDYAIPHQHVEFQPADSPLRQGSYRCLAATANVFARESHVDEVAHAVGVDPLDLRLGNLREARLRNVLLAAATRFGWRARRSRPDRGYGLACAHEKDAYVATFVEVAVGSGPGEVTVERAVTAFECGALVNPASVESQVEGSVIMGLGGALFEAIDFADGRIENPRLSRYRVPRFSDMPRLETLLLDRPDLPSAGAGETAIVAIAPAIANALFAATGERVRSLPLLAHRT